MADQLLRQPTTPIQKLGGQLTELAEEQKSEQTAKAAVKRTGEALAGPKSKKHKANDTIAADEDPKTAASRKRKNDEFDSAPKERKAILTTKRSFTRPAGREKYNVEPAGYPQGELEFGRARGSQRINWRIHYSADDEVGDLFFGPPNEKYGGPLRWLSNMYVADFNIANLIGRYTFDSVERAMQWIKAAHMSIPKHRWSTGLIPKVSSKQLMSLLCSRKAPVEDLEGFTSSWDYWKRRDPVWWKTWFPLWEFGMRHGMKMAVYAKFKDNLELKTLLMMTGKFKLRLASEDKVLGIGYTALEAPARRNTWGENMVGEVLMEVRDQILEEEPEWPEVFAFDYFRAAEMEHPAKQDPLGTAYSGISSAKAKEKWLESGGPALELLLTRLTLAETQLHEKRPELVREFEEILEEGDRKANALGPEKSECWGGFTD